MFYYNIRTANVNVYYQVSLHCMISLPIQPIQLPPSVWRYRAMRRTFSEVQLRDGQSERGQASQLFEQKCFILNSFYKHFCEFCLPELNCPALANAATVSEHSYDIFTYSASDKCLEISCNARKLSAKCLEMGSPSEDKQANCLSKNASY